MEQITNAEQLRLPEQLYILLFDLADGKTDYLQLRMVHAIATAIVYELLDAGALLTQEKMVKKVQRIAFKEEYLQEAALCATDRVPLYGYDLIWELANELHPIWETVAEDMIAKKLLTQVIQNRFIIFHHKVFRGLPDAQKCLQELQSSITQTMHNIQNPEYDITLLYSHWRLLALLIILDNHKLLRIMIGNRTYQLIKAYIRNIRGNLREIERNSDSVAARYAWNQSSNSSAVQEIYDSGSIIWLDPPDYSGHGGQGVDDGQFDILQREIDGLGPRDC